MKLQRTKRLGAILGLVLLGQSVIACTQEPTATSPAATVAATAQPPATYVVQRGDRLIDIAAERDIPLGVLIELNDIPNPDVIEVGDVILLEAAPAEPIGSTASAPLPRIVQVEPVEESFSERLNQWWADAPKPSLAGDAVQQGIFAAIALPAAVIASVLLLMVGRLAVRLLRDATRFARARSSGSANPEQQSEPGETEVRPQGRRRLPSFAFAGSGARRLAIATGGLGTRIRAIGVGWLTRPLAVVARVMAARVRWAAAMTVHAARYIGRVLHLNARKAVGVQAARRERARDQEFQRESRGWWSQGRERLRIGLLDEAEECFETGLRLAVEGGWQDEISLYRSELRLLEERRGVERSLVSSVHKM